MPTESSVFTKIINRELPGYIPYEDDVVAVLVAIEGHLLVVPKVQYRDVFELPEDEAAHLMKVAVRMAKALQEATGCEGINLIQSNGATAGQEVFHFHLHIKQRSPNDGVVLKWDTTMRPAEERETLAEAVKTVLSSK